MSDVFSPLIYFLQHTDHSYVSPNWFYGHSRHWCRLVKNIGGVKPNLGGNVVKTDKCIGVSKILWVRVWLPPKSTPITLDLDQKLNLIDDDRTRVLIFFTFNRQL